MNLEDIYIKAQWCDELLKEIDEIKKAKYPDLYIDTGSNLNVALAVLKQVKKDLKIKKKINRAKQKQVKELLNNENS